MNFIDVKVLHTIIDNTIDEDVFNQMSRELFFRILKKANLDLDKLASKRKKNDYIPFHKFNFIIKELHENKQLDITDQCILLQTESLPTKDIVGCLNEENLFALRTSLAERNNIKTKKYSLDMFMKKKNQISPKNRNIL